MQNTTTKHTRGGFVVAVRGGARGGEFLWVFHPAGTAPLLSSPPFSLPLMSLLGNCFTNRANLQSCMPGKDNQYPHTLARIRHAHNAVVPVIDTRRVITPRMDAPAVGGSSRGSSRCSGRGSSHGTVGSGKKESSARAAEGVRSAVRPAASAASHSKRSTQSGVTQSLQQSRPSTSSSRRGHPSSSATAATRTARPRPSVRCSRAWRASR